MAKCLDITPKRKKICIGALRYRINIYDRVLTVPSVQNTAIHSETYTLFKTVFAAIETKNTNVLQTLDGVAFPEELIVTHVFTTRFLSTINTEQFIEFGGKNYKILKAENIDEADLWLKLRANLRGTFTISGAQ